MDIIHNFHNKITYDITITCVADRIGLKMHAQDLRSEKIFEKIIDHDDQMKK